MARTAAPRATASGTSYVVARTNCQPGLDYLGIQLDDAKTAGKALAINFEVEGTGQKYALVLKNRVLNSSATPVASPDLTIKIGTATGWGVSAHTRRRGAP